MVVDEGWGMFVGSDHVGSDHHHHSNDRDLRSLEAGSVGAHVEAVQSSFQM